MAERQSRYDQMQRYMTYALLAALALFIFYLIAAGAGVIWLKAVFAILIFLICGACLVFLYLTQELLRHRSLWMTLAAGAIAICLLFSLVLNFPSPNPLKQAQSAEEDTAWVVTAENI